MPLNHTQTQLRNQLEIVILQALRLRLEDFIAHDLTEKVIEETRPNMGPQRQIKYRHNDGNLFAVIHDSQVGGENKLEISVAQRESLLMTCSYRLRDASEALHYKKE